MAQIGIVSCMFEKAKRDFLDFLIFLMNVVNVMVHFIPSIQSGSIFVCVCCDYVFSSQSSNFVVISIHLSSFVDSVKTHSYGRSNENVHHFNRTSLFRINVKTFGMSLVCYVCFLTLFDVAKVILLRHFVLLCS